MKHYKVSFWLWYKDSQQNHIIYAASKAQVKRIVNAAWGRVNKLTIEELEV